MVFKGFNKFGDSTFSNVLGESFISFLDYGFVNASGFFNYSGTNDYTKLVKISHPKYKDGRVWGSRRKNWVWEPEGIQISGVYVNNTFRTSGYSINYRDGYILFDNPVSGNIRVNYSSKYIEVVDGAKNAFFNGDEESFEVQNSQFIAGSGIPFSQDRVQLPAVVIEVVNNRKSKPYEIGFPTNYIENDIMVNVLAETDYQAKEIVDIIANQEGKIIRLFDVNKMKVSGLYPISVDGFLVNPSGYYTNISEDYKWDRVYHDCYLQDNTVENIEKLGPKLYHGSIRCTTKSTIILD